MEDAYCGMQAVEESMPHTLGFIRTAIRALAPRFQFQLAYDCGASRVGARQEHGTLLSISVRGTFERQVRCGTTSGLHASSEESFNSSSCTSDRNRQHRALEEKLQAQVR